MIKAGIGGWNFAPWRDTFYPKEVSKPRELHYASRHVATIEINSTYYGTQKPESFRRWADETPDDFIFSVKASRFATNRRVLAEAGPSIARFIDSGITALGGKLGPLLWQFAPTKAFDPADFSAFLAGLPKTHDGFALRHAVEVRHPSFVTADFIMLARRHGVTVVLAESAKYPMIADVTADFVYVRLQRASENVATGYTTAALEKWIERARAWEAGGPADGLPLLAPHVPAKKRDVFVYMINGAKERAPAAAMAFQDLLKA